MARWSIPGFTGLSEFAAGHNDDCGPAAEEMALAIVQRRPPSAQHMDALRTRGIAEGWFKNRAGESVQGIYDDLIKYERIRATLLPDGTSFDAIHQQARDAVVNGNPVILNLTNAHALAHIESDVFGHFVTLGGYDAATDSFLVGSGDYVVGRGVQTNGATPLYWATWDALVLAHPSGAVILDASSYTPIPQVWRGIESAKALWPWLLPLDTSHISQFWNGSTELGIDLELPTGTPITSLTYGKVVNSFYFGGGGVVVVKAQLPGIGVATLYYQHLDVNVVQINDIVRIGDLIGYSGGQLHGGHHPVTCCSTGPHLEVGINGGSASSAWKGMGPNRNPLPYLTALVTNGPPSWDLIASNKAPITNGGASSWLAAAHDSIQGQGPTADSFVGMCLALDEAMEFQTSAGNVQVSIWPWDWQQDINNYGKAYGALLGHNIAALFLRGMFVLLGFLIIIAFLFHLVFGADEGRSAVQAGASVAGGATVTEVATPTAAVAVVP